MTSAQRRYLREHGLSGSKLAWEPGQIAYLPDGRFLLPDGIPYVKYTCEHCRETFLSDWSDDDATAEFTSLFGDLPPDEEMAVICATCFQAEARLGYIPTRN